MRMRFVVPVVLVVGIVLGGLAARELCNRGYCDEPDVTVERDSESGTNTIFQAGSPDDDPGPIATDTPLICLKIPETAQATAAPSVTVSGSEAWSGVQHDCHARSIKGLAIIGDSGSDEYRADNPRGEEYGENTFNWVELLERERSINVGSWGERPEPRRGGYEFNWARSGATSTSMLSDGQHLGLAEQIRNGQVSHVVIQIGTNDFSEGELGPSIYQGVLAEDEVRKRLDHVAENIGIAVRELKLAGADSIVIMAVKDFLTIELVPETGEVAPDPNGRLRITAAYEYLNQRIAEVALEEGVTFFDFNSAIRNELAARYDPNDRDYILVGDERISLAERGNDPRHALLDDQYLHPGTVLSGLIANLFIDELNQVFGLEIEKFSDDELLRFAGIRN